MEYVLLGFSVFITLTVLFIAWATQQSRHTVDRMQHDVEELKRRPT